MLHAYVIFVEIRFKHWASGIANFHFISKRLGNRARSVAFFCFINIREGGWACGIADSVFIGI